MLFAGWDWHIRNKESSTLIKYISIFLHQWRMPLLFFISGAGTFFALGFRKPIDFIQERIKRLIVPLVAGCFIVVAPQVYIERIDKYDSYLEFFPHFLDGIYPKGNFSWHHLWFVAYLFSYSIFLLPIFLKLRNSRNAYNRFTKFFYSKFGVFLFVIPIILSQFLLRPFFPKDTLKLIDDWACFTYYLFFFFYGFLVCYSHSWDKIKEDSSFNLFFAVLSVVLLYISHWKILHNPNYHIYLRGAVRIIIQTMTAWYCVLCFIGYGQKFLNKNNPFLQYANEGIYPFYILHQVAIVIIGYYVIKWNINLYIKYIVVSNASLISCIIVYWFFVRPFRITRFIFGMKSRV